MADEQSPSSFISVHYSIPAQLVNCNSGVTCLGSHIHSCQFVNYDILPTEADCTKDKTSHRWCIQFLYHICWSRIVWIVNDAALSVEMVMPSIITSVPHPFLSVHRMNCDLWLWWYYVPPPLLITRTITWIKSGENNEKLVAFARACQIYAIPRSTSNNVCGGVLYYLWWCSLLLATSALCWCLTSWWRGTVVERQSDKAAAPVQSQERIDWVCKHHINRSLCVWWKSGEK